MHHIDDRGLRDLEREDALGRAELLASTAARLLSAEDPQRVVEDLCRDVMRHLGCQVFFNYLVDARADCLVLNAYAGIDAEEAREIELLDLGVAVCGCAALRAERVVAEDIQHTGRSDAGARALLRVRGLRRASAARRAAR